METKPTVRVLGRFIVADPEICHGQPTFRGTRIFVDGALNIVSDGNAIPWRARARSSCFSNLWVTSDLCRGCLIASATRNCCRPKRKA